MNKISNFADYENQYLQSIEYTDAYWGEVASNYHWFQKWNTVLTGNFKEQNVKWFDGATTNLSYNCLDRHLKKNGNKTALIFVSNELNSENEHFTFKQLHEKVCQFANVLISKGVQKGDRVCFYMGMTPELLIGILACTRIGAIHSVVFGGFSAVSLAGRLNDCKAKILVTSDGGLRGNKVIHLKEIADEALKHCPAVETVLVHKRANNEIFMSPGRDEILNGLLDNASKEFEATQIESEDPLFILYTSGSTGTPKGLLHTTGGYMVWAGETFKNVFQMDEDDIFWCTADIGWITGHTYLTYAPLLNANTTVMFEGVPTYPDAGRFWQVVEDLKVTHFYTAPTAIRALQACELDFVKKYDLSSLKVLGSVGEPINEEAWEWYNVHVGNKKCPIVDTWWQTETGGIMISPLAGITKLKPGHATLPLPGVQPGLFTHEGEEISQTQAQGILCIKKPWPGMARTIWGNPQRYKETYFSTYEGLYFTGDGAKRDEEGFYRITGRVDDVINVSGHRIGTAEVEDAIDQHPKVVEAAVVGFPHDIKGQGIFAYVILSEPMESNQLKKEVNSIVTEMIGAIARPDEIKVVSALPKTRSGKIMRRILRKVAAGDTKDLGDISTLLNPEVVEELLS
ncbi:MAG: acetate--CoA ligase [Halobacteriovoraceae bacterium]|nr:acetate--CoA ligase [Halobacteriovoraceae bacterium]